MTLDARTQAALDSAMNRCGLSARQKKLAIPLILLLIEHGTLGIRETSEVFAFAAHAAYQIDLETLAAHLMAEYADNDH
jgi:hypothetical protein